MADKAQDGAAPTLKQKIQAAAEALAARGWAHIPGVLDAEECEAYKTGVWKWLSSFGENISPSDPSSWVEDRGWPPSWNGIINALEVAHQDFVWKIRSNPKIVQVFAELYGTNELLSSFDSINVTRPGTNAQTGWLHVDQAPTRQGLHCIQGLVNLVDTGPDTTGSLLVKDKSHALHKEFFANHTSLTPEEKQHTGDFYMFKPQELPFWEQLPSLGLSAKAGDMFLWDSRTVHQNAGPESTTDWRHVVYCCYQPRSLATEKDLQLKKQAWDDYRITTHWPAHNVTLFPSLGETYFKMHSMVPGAKKDGDKQGLGFWEQRVANGDIDQLLQRVRTRDRVDNSTIRKLAGLEPYAADEVWHQEPLLKLGV